MCDTSTDSCDLSSDSLTTMTSIADLLPASATVEEDSKEQRENNALEQELTERMKKLGILPRAKEQKLEQVSPIKDQKLEKMQTYTAKGKELKPECSAKEKVALVPLHEQAEALRRELCRLLEEREKVRSAGCGGGGLEEKVREAKAKLQRAKDNREQLRLHYNRKEQERKKQMPGATTELYLQLKEQYFALVLKAGEGDKEVKDLESDLVVATNTVSRLQRKLWQAGGEDSAGQDNLWQVGVAYGSGRAGR